MQKAQKLTDTSIGKKALVAITGAILFGFVIVHLLGNLQVFLGPEHLNEYAETLQSFPKLVWSARLVLLLAFVVHVALTVQIATRSRAARASRYKMLEDVAAQPWLERYARHTMIWSGLIVFAFLIFHLAHLTLGANVVPGYDFVRGDVYSNVIHGFRHEYITAFYVFANVLLGIHLFHGAHSALQSLGLRSPRFDPHLRGVAIALAVVVTLGNVIMPLAILYGAIGREVG